MNLTIFPAMPGTYVVERERGEKEPYRVPVIGFASMGGPCFPIMAMPHGGLTLGKALLTPDGFVSDPAFGQVFASLDEWMKITDTEAYWKAKAKTVPGSPAKATATTEAEIGKANTDADIASDPGPEKPAAAPRRAARKGKPQVFKNKTFWRLVDAEGHYPKGAIFEIEGGGEAPAKNDARFEKIKRDDYQAMKRDGAAVATWKDDPDDDMDHADDADINSLI